MQDDTRYIDSLEYLKQTLRILQYLQEQLPGGFIILLHKSDPELVSMPIFQEKVDYMMEKVKELFQAFNQSLSESQNKYEFEIQISSIYNSISMTPSFSNMLKSLFSKDATAEDRNNQELLDLISNVMNLFQDLDKKLNGELDLIKLRLLALEGKKVQPQPTITVKSPLGKPLSAPPSATPSIQSAQKIPAIKSTRSALMHELKEIFGIMKQNK